MTASSLAGYRDPAPSGDSHDTHPFFLWVTVVIDHDLIVQAADSRTNSTANLTELVMEWRGQAMVVTHNAMPADSTVAATYRH